MAFSGQGSGMLGAVWHSTVKACLAPVEKH